MNDSEGFLRRLACQIAAQLPQDQAEALRALRLARQIVFNLGEEWEAAGSSEPVQLYPDQGARLKAVQEGRSGPPDKSSLV